ncbi:aminoacyl-tRNA hydrolase [Paenibacillus thermoaerophilus]|uniref:Peptidyl-tRNA hydrolase n=1 Tax=Paenibacillus thermoaerophilus TaxID=1215385 RepID=A0ABW2V5H4_9BACL|nr:aminoacyl-tRNA hydrolase [Paenibacillus thermoaerophilus]TMV09462.1 aminoacyl-tRNA hydrolase [Paenibacillus thermoaerophilus]
MKWIVGLGNPGKPYERTRHNIGFLAVDRLAADWGISVTQSRFKALVGEGQAGGQKVFLIKPMTYMNLSGETIRAFMDFYKTDMTDCIVIYDDLDTPFGQMRLRYKGSAGGHNGIKSIIQHAGTQQFNRVRMGISRPAPGSNIADYVLSNFTKAEWEALPGILNRAAEAVTAALREPFDKVMARFNGQEG